MASKTDESYYEMSDVPAEYRTDLDHLQVIKAGAGLYTFRRSSRKYDQISGSYSEWADWKTELYNHPLSRVMHAFSQMVLQQSAIDEYRWGSETRINST
ncbi:MAG: hypothetical protein ACW97A_11725 [Candidatus Thorarchaeota archaeon]